MVEPDQITVRSAYFEWPGLNSMAGIEILKSKSSNNNIFYSDAICGFRNYLESQGLRWSATEYLNQSDIKL